DRSRERATGADDWVELDAVRGALEQGAVLVEVARIAVYDFQAKVGAGRWLAPHYAAWVIPARGAGDVQLFDLGEAEAIDADIVAFRKAMAGAGEAINAEGEEKAEAQIRRALEALSKRVLRPIESALASSPRWVISPDSGLWLVPWEAL